VAYLFKPPTIRSITHPSSSRSRRHTSGLSWPQVRLHLNRGAFTAGSCRDQREFVNATRRALRLMYENPLVFVLPNPLAQWRAPRCRHQELEAQGPRVRSRISMPTTGNLRSTALTSPRSRRTGASYRSRPPKKAFEANGADRRCQSRDREAPVGRYLILQFPLWCVPTMAGHPQGLGRPCVRLRVLRLWAREHSESDGVTATVRDLGGKRAKLIVTAGG